MTTTTKATGTDNRMDWVHGTTTHHKSGRAFIATDAEGFNLFVCRVPWKSGTLVATVATLAEAKAAAQRYL